MNPLHLSVALTTLLAVGQAPEEASSRPVRPGEVVAFFQDGTVIRRVALQGSVEITTKYGKLVVPVSDIRRIEFGFRLPEEVARQINQAIRQLGSDQFKAREAASKELVTLGVRAYPALLIAAKSGDKEVATRAAAALERIRAEVSEDDLHFKEEDVLHTRDCVLAGSIQGPVLKGQTANFGELPLKLADLRAISSSGVSKAALKVDVAQVGAYPEGWLETTFEVDADIGIVLVATGQADLMPQQPGQAISGPEGTGNAGRYGGLLPGMLLGRIGEKGDVFIIGRRYEGRSTQAGKLYLQMVPVPGGGQPTGEYVVNATAGFEIAPGRRASAGGTVLTPFQGTTATGFGPAGNFPGGGRPARGGRGGVGGGPGQP